MEVTPVSNQGLGQHDLESLTEAGIPVAYWPHQVESCGEDVRGWWLDSDRNVQRRHGLVLYCRTFVELASAARDLAALAKRILGHWQQLPMPHASPPMLYVSASSVCGMRVDPDLTAVARTAAVLFLHDAGAATDHQIRDVAGLALRRKANGLLTFVAIYDGFSADAAQDLRAALAV